MVGQLIHRAATDSVCRADGGQSALRTRGARRSRYGYMVLLDDRQLTLDASRTPNTAEFVIFIWNMETQSAGIRGPVQTVNIMHKCA
jgi:hypothetical protein